MTNLIALTQFTYTIMFVKLQVNEVLIGKIPQPEVSQE